ncbi:hypothetical protein HID58_060317 [Brassica napus]|uniref:Sulfotransferase n=1 Tax=Brassica napus TaxID=3708 RepID=A0ABQ7ZVC5_BRANA|nr:hypothetical protein HID58_060317 [Brassica napus]
MDPKGAPSILRNDKISEETNKLISSLLSRTDSQGQKLCQYQGCWYYYNTLQGVLNFQSGFQPQDTDIILASYPKSGTTWLKALTVALMERPKNNSYSSDDEHPLLYDNPHGIVPCLEMDVYHESSSPNLAKFSAPRRLFSTHMPLHAMEEAHKHSACKIVGILESLFESFCNGTIYYGPFWEHLLSYWRATLEEPKHVLFMRYEELKAEPRHQIKRLAEFLGCPFTKQEEESGVVDKILDLCSLRNLSSLEVNKTGSRNDVDHKDYFRKGEVGDSKNYLTPEMEYKIDMIIQEKLQGSGLKF